jgi:vacuolar-type H+-ATPase subunit E/Vma4
MTNYSFEINLEKVLPQIVKAKQTKCKRIILKIAGTMEDVETEEKEAAEEDR